MSMMRDDEAPLDEVLVDEALVDEVQVDEVPVNVNLQGLMFARFVRTGDALAPYYEIGVLTAKCHDFTVCFEVDDLHSGKQLTASEVAPPSEGCYVLEIYRPDSYGCYRILRSNATKFICRDLEFNRPRLSMRPDLPDTVKQDYRWVSDLESREFHDKKLNMISKKVHPLIKFPNGRVHTAKRTDDPLERIQGQDRQVFGYMGDIVGIDIPARPGDVLILRERKAKTAILRILLTAETMVIITITNVPPVEPVMDHSTSHFKIYYGAINDNTIEPFDFIPIKKPAPHMMDHMVLDDNVKDESPADCPPGAVKDPPEVCRGGGGGGGAPLCGGVNMSKHDTEF